jgi:hypothetical protein
VLGISGVDGHALRRADALCKRKRAAQLPADTPTLNAMLRASDGILDMLPNTTAALA